MGAGSDRLGRELVMVQATGCRRVGLLPGVHKDYEKLEARFRSRLQRHFKNYGIPGTSMPKEHFNTEGRYPTGGARSKDVQVCAFKAFQARIYGVVIEIAGVETFVGLDIISNKKKNRADQDLLRRVAKRFQPYQD